MIMMTVAPVVRAVEPQAPIGKQRAMEIAKEMLQINANYTLNRTYFNTDEQGNKLWGFNWTVKGAKERLIDVTVDAVTGKVRNFYRLEPDNNGPKKYSRQEAQKIAEDFLRRMNPDLVDETRLELPAEMMTPADINEGLEVQFNFVRIANGFPFWNTGVNIGVSTANGRVTSYHFNWVQEAPPAAEHAISLREAKKIFNERLGLELGYLRINPQLAAEKIPEPRVIPAYYPRVIMGPSMIDGLTGAIIGPFGKPVNVPEAVYSTLPGTSAPRIRPERPLDMEQAMQRAMSVVSIPEGFKLSWTNYEENADPRRQPTWQFSWLNRKAPYGNIFVSVNALTGDIVSLDVFTDNPWHMQEARITEAEAKSIALEYFRKMFPDRVGEVRLESSNYLNDIYLNNDGKRPFYDVRFTRLVNGVPFSDNFILINVDGRGEVNRFYSYWENEQFPDLGGIISLAEANEKFNAANTLEAGYVQLPKEDGSTETRLVYRVAVDEKIVDAKTGNVISRYNGISLDARAYSYRDLGGHWAKQDIAFLAKNNIVNPQDNAFFPNQAITRADIITMLVKALDLNPYFARKPAFADVPKTHQAYGYIEAAFKAGIVQGSAGKFAPDALITREETAVVLVKALGEKVVKGDKTDFLDKDKIAAWAQKDVAAAAATGIIKGDAKGYFKPRANVTRGEAAAMVARVFEKLTKLGQKQS